jgi:hypothetical protein
MPKVIEKNKVKSGQSALKKLSGMVCYLIVLTHQIEKGPEIHFAF